jgi:hypothetical protein
MEQIIIRECPVCGTIRERAARVAEELRKEPGYHVELIDGDRGEFSVTIDGREVVRKGHKLPEVDEVTDIVRGAVPVGAIGDDG